MEKIIAHVDMDSFYCSCEELLDPSLHDKPFIVGHDSNRGVASTSNYVARKYGVFAAMPVKIAKSKCKDLVIVNPTYGLYSKKSKEVFEILKSFTDNLYKASIDEAYLDLTWFATKFDSLPDMANYIKNAVFKKTGLTCSVGVSNCRLCSKIASDFNKPNGITIVDDKKEFLSSLDICKIPGIGKKSKLKFYANEINKIKDLQVANNVFLFEKFGENACKYKKIVNGELDLDIPKRGRAKSYSREITFSNDVSDYNKLHDIVDKLSNRVYADLGNNYFKTISIKLRYYDFKTITRNISLNYIDNSLATIKRCIFNILRNVFREGDLIRLIGVCISNIMHFRGVQKKITDYC
jgi:DNA polymerase-4